MNLLLALILLLPQSPNTIGTTETFVPGNRFLDVHSIRLVWFSPKDCRYSVDPVRTDNGKLTVRECKKIIVEFGAIKAPRKGSDEDNGWIQPNGDTDATAAPQSAYTPSFTLHYQPHYCKPLGDRNDRYVCGGKKGTYAAYWSLNNQ